MARSAEDQGSGRSHQARRLGKTEIAVSPIGLGCWQFSQGRGLAGTYWPSLSDAEVNEIVAASLAGGVEWFDTAEMYGRGASERALARALRAGGVVPEKVVVATKWLPLFRRARSIRTTIGRRIEALGGYGIDLYQIHQPWSFSSVEAEMDAMADLMDAGLVRSVGVSNFGEAQMRRAHAALQQRGIPLASNQVGYSLINRGAERSGLLAAARELGVSIIAYSPLGQGLLSGVYHDDPERIRQRPGARKWMGRFRRKGIERTRALVAELRRVGKERGATPAQVALSWLVNRHGDLVVAIPGATNARQASENAAAQEIVLSRADSDRIEAASRAVTG